MPRTQPGRRHQARLAMVCSSRRSRRCTSPTRAGNSSTVVEEATSTVVSAFTATTGSFANSASVAS